MTGTNADHSNSNGKISIFVDNGDGYILETTDPDLAYDKGSTVIEKCFDSLKGVQVHGPSGEAALRLKL